MAGRVQVSAWGIRHMLGPVSLLTRGENGEEVPVPISDHPVTLRLPEIPGHIKKSFGVTAMEIPDYNLNDATAEEREAFREALIAEGVTLATVTIDRHAIGEANDKYRAEDLASIRTSLTRAAKCGALRARINLFPPPVVPHPETASYDTIVGHLKELLAFGKEIGLEILIENHCELTDTPEKIRRITGDVPGLRFILDSGNIGSLSAVVLASRESGELPEDAPHPEDSYEFVEALINEAALVHIKTYGYKPDGSSYVYDIDRVISLIANSSYTGPVTIECASFIPSLVYDAIQRTVEKLNKVLP